MPKATFLQDFPVLPFPPSKILCAVLIEKNLDQELVLAISTSHTKEAWTLITVDLKTNQYHQIPYEIPSIHRLGTLDVSSGIVHFFVLPNPERVLGYTWHPKSNTVEMMPNLGLELFTNHSTEEIEYSQWIESVVYLSPF